MIYSSFFYLLAIYLRLGTVNEKTIAFYNIYNLCFSSNKENKIRRLTMRFIFIFIGLSLRNTSKALSKFVKRSYTAIRGWIQRYQPEKILSKRKKIDGCIIDETLIKDGSEFVWLWVAVEPENKQVLAVPLPKISKERNMFVSERFLADIIKIYGKHTVSTDGAS